MSVVIRLELVGFKIHLLRIHLSLRGRLLIALNRSRLRGNSRTTLDSRLPPRHVMCWYLRSFRRRDLGTASMTKSNRRCVIGSQYSLVPSVEAGVAALNCLLGFHTRKP